MPPTTPRTAVLIDVAELWEMFVLHCFGLVTELPVRHGTTEHVSGHLARSSVDPRLTLGKLYPDVLVEEDPVAAVIDAKYKRLGGRRGGGPRGPIPAGGRRAAGRGAWNEVILQVRDPEKFLEKL